WDIGEGAHTKGNGNYKHPRQVTPDDEPVPRWKGYDYFYDAEAIREPQAESTFDRFQQNCERIIGQKEKVANPVEVRANGTFQRPEAILKTGRNKRTVWTVATQSYSEANFAT